MNDGQNAPNAHELQEAIKEALGDPITRVGALHNIEATRLYEDQVPGGSPFFSLEITWMEVGDDPNECGIVALRLHIPVPIIVTVKEKLRILLDAPNASAN